MPSHLPCSICSCATPRRVDIDRLLFEEETLHQSEEDRWRWHACRIWEGCQCFPSGQRRRRHLARGGGKDSDRPTPNIQPIDHLTPWWLELSRPYASIVHLISPEQYHMSGSPPTLIQFPTSADPRDSFVQEYHAKPTCSSIMPSLRA